MNKSVKCTLTALLVCAVSAFAVMASGCKIKQAINELRCDHIMIDGEVTKEATCTEEGEMERKCSLCTYTETKKLDKLEHTTITLLSVAPTCTKSGLTEGQKCGECGEIFIAQTVLSPTGHAPVIDKAVVPTCTAVGKTEGSHCGSCGTVFVAQEDIPMVEHVLKEMESYGATCEDKGFTGGVKCENCDYATSGEVIPALGHSYDEGVETTAPTCVTDGEKIYTCTRCEGTKIDTLPAIGHNSENGICTVCGTNIISFVVKHENRAGGFYYFNCTAVNGMTWREFCNIPFLAQGYSVDSVYIRCGSTYPVEYEDGSYVRPDDKIIAGYEYFICYGLVPA